MSHVFRRLKTKLSSDCQELESESAGLRSRLTAAREKLAVIEEEAMVAKATVKQKEVEAEQIRKVRDVAKCETVRLF